MGIALNCQRCGEKMPELDDDLESLVRAGKSFSMTHDVCPRDAGKSGPEEGMRYFEVRCSLVEVIPQDGLTLPVEELLQDFKAGAAAVDFESSLDQLASRLGEKWVLMRSTAAIADPRSVVNTLPPKAGA